MQLQVSEMTFFEGRRAEILKETAAEQQRGRAWETRLRQAASETRELRKSLDEEERICKERTDTLNQRRQRHSAEWSDLQEAITMASVSTSQSLSGLRLASSSRQEKLKQELSTAEALRSEIIDQVSES